MSGPWEDYAVAESGPWQDYAPRTPQYGNNDVLADGTRVPVGSTEAIAARSPVAGQSFLQNAQQGVGKLYTDALLGVRQLYAGAADTVAPQTSTRLAQLQAEAADKRQVDAPLQATAGAKVGEIAGALPLAFVPGANTYAGAAALGGVMGAVQPTIAGESRLLNTGLGTGLGVAGKGVGDALSNFVASRAAQPFMGWNQGTANKAAAAAVGSEAQALKQPELAATGARLGKVFSQARDPAVSVQIPNQTSQVISNAEGNLSASAKADFWRNPQVNELMTHLQNGTANAQELGTISSKLGSAAASEMATKTGDRALGKSLFEIQNHIDDLVGQSITDPALSAAYAAARPEYRMFLTLAKRPTILNSATGDVNMRNLGNYLQRSDFTGYTKGANTSDIYNAARFGQATGLGSRPPPPILQPLKWASFHAANNPVVNATGGITSRALSPVRPALSPGLEGLGLSSVPYAAELQW